MWVRMVGAGDVGACTVCVRMTAAGADRSAAASEPCATECGGAIVDAFSGVNGANAECPVEGRSSNTGPEEAPDDPDPANAARSGS